MSPNLFPFVTWLVLLLTFGVGAIVLTLFAYSILRPAFASSPRKALVIACVIGFGIALSCMIAWSVFDIAMDRLDS